jgi:hypothetical protein
MKISFRLGIDPWVIFCDDETADYKNIYLNIEKIAYKTNKNF